MKITQDKIIQINELYLQYGTYSAVAKEVGCAPSTVKKYVDPDYKPIQRQVELKPVDWNVLITAKLIDIMGREWDK